MAIGPSTFTTGVDFNTAGTAGGNSIALAKPSGVVDKDYLFVFFQNQTGGGTITPPAGWTSAGISITTRTAQLYWKYIPTASAETATSYTFATSVSARMAGEIFRVSGLNTTNPFDVKAAAETTGGAGAVNIASLTASAAGNVAMVFPFSNGAISGTAYAYGNGFTDSGIDGVGNPGGTRTDVGMGFKLLTAAGAVGTTTVTGFAGTPNGFMVVLAKGPATYTATADATATASTTAAVSTGVTADQAATASTSAAASRTLAATAAQTVTAATTAAIQTPVEAWLARQPNYVAHRGGSADWDQSTMYAYDLAAAWSSDLALEVSIWKSADGVWVANHDNDPSVTGTWANPGSGNITARNWVGDLQNIVSSGHGSPMIRLIDVLAKYASSRIIVVDNKAAKDLSTATVGATFLATLNAYGGNSRIILKSFYTGTDMSAFARANGFKTWGYYYNADAANVASTASRWDILGMEYGATTGWDAVVATGLPFWAHILPTAAAKTMADAHTVKPNGYMVSGVMEVVPPTGVTADQTVAASTAAAAQRTTPATSGVSVTAQTASNATRTTAAGADQTATATTDALAARTTAAIASLTVATTTTALAARTSSIAASTIASATTSATIAAGVERDLDLVATPLPLRWMASAHSTRFASEPLPARWLITSERSMRTIYLAEGFGSRVGGTIRETQGSDISGATIKVAFVQANDQPPATSAADWVLPSDDQPGSSNSQRVIKYMPPQATPPGVYRLWAWIADNPDNDPVILEDGIRVA